MEMSDSQFESALVAGMLASRMIASACPFGREEMHRPRSSPALPHARLLRGGSGIKILEDPAAHRAAGMNYPSFEGQCFVGVLIAIRFALVCARSDFGRVTLRTPFLNTASIFSSSMSMPTGIRRSKRP